MTTLAAKVNVTGWILNTQKMSRISSVCHEYLFALFRVTPLLDIIGNAIKGIRIAIPFKLYDEATVLAELIGPNYYTLHSSNILQFTLCPFCVLRLLEQVNKFGNYEPKHTYCFSLYNMFHFQKKKDTNNHAKPYTVITWALTLVTKCMHTLTNKEMKDAPEMKKGHFL